jgi:hypothetical protein
MRSSSTSPTPATGPASALPISKRTTAEIFRHQGAALADHDLGNAKEAQQSLNELISKSATTGAYQIAEVYAWWGNKDQAVQWLERAYAQYDGGLNLVKVDPLQRSLRPDARYAVLLREMKFQDGTNLVGAARKLFGP